MDGTPPNINTTSTLQVLLPDFTDRAPLFSSWPGCTEGILKHLFISWFSCKPLALISSLCETPACLFFNFFCRAAPVLAGTKMASKAEEPQCSRCLPPSKGRPSLLPAQAHPLQRAGALLPTETSSQQEFSSRLFPQLKSCLFPPGLFTLSFSKQSTKSRSKAMRSL